MSLADPLEAGRDALNRYAWPEAYDALKEADQAGPLGGDGLRLLSEAAWWTAHPDETIDVAERAYRAFLEEGDGPQAAMMAWELARQHIMRGSFDPGMAWMTKAEQLAAQDPEMPAHGYLAFMRGLMAFFQDDLDGSLANLDQALEVARRIGDADLYAMSLHDKGHNLVIAGRVAEGMALIDEAMVSAIGGELKPAAAGYVYCAMISLCSRTGDYRRAAEWTEATTRWCERNGITGFPGICRVHRAEVLRLRGAWPRAEEEALRACDELPRYNLVFGLGVALYEIGEIRRRMGDLAGAEESFGRAYEYGHPPHPGLALVWLAQGKTDAAEKGIRQAATEASTDRSRRIRVLAAQAEVAGAAGDVATAAGAVEELDAIVADFDSVALRAMADAARGVVRLAEGNLDEAIGDLRRAVRGWQQIEAPYEVAENRLHLGRALHGSGDTEAAILEVRAARTAFERLGATNAVQRTVSLLSELSVTDAPERVDRAFVFTDIVRSTDLVSAMGDEAWEELLTWHDQKLRSVFAMHRGEVAHHTGDGFFVAFDDPGAAVAAAMAVQRALAEHRREHGFAPQVRMGVHAARATRRSDRDYSGAEVHKAARIAAIADAGEILASAETVEALDGVTASPTREVALKGIAEPTAVVAVEWR